MKKTQVVFITMATMIVLYFVTIIPMLGVRMLKIKDAYPLVDWDEYSRPEDLVNASDYVYEGKVVGISFDTLNMYTGQSMKNSDSPGNVDLNTIYEIEISKVYKGELSSKAAIQVLGGRKNYKEFEQKLVLAKADMPYRMLLDGMPDIKIGESYIFFTDRGVTDKQIQVTLEQFALSEKDVNSKNSVNYNSVKEYLASEKYTNPKKVPTTYVEVNQPVSTSAEEIVKNNTNVFEGRVCNIEFLAGKEFYIQYTILVENTYKGSDEILQGIRIKSGTDDYNVDEQYRLLNSAEIDNRIVFKNMTTPEIGKTYLFAINDMYNCNPAQFAFCSDNSNAPGGVDYKMMKEYLEK